MSRSARRCLHTSYLWYEVSGIGPVFLSQGARGCFRGQTNRTSNISPITTSWFGAEALLICMICMICTNQLMLPDGSRA